MPDIIHVDGYMSEACTAMGHGLRAVYADADGNLYISAPLDEALIHAHD
jgi:hypothetical protein